MRKKLVTWLMLTGLATALPEGGQVQHGQIQILNAGSLMQVLQSSPQGIINWSSFSISPQEIVQFLQAGGGVTLNRVTGQQPSLIEGLLQANGSVFLLNPNGILFTPTANVNAGSFLASTLSMTDQDFLAGNYRLHQDPSKGLAAIVNQGRLEVGEGGYLVLASPLIHNEGLIVARQGQIQVGASTEATLTFDPQGLLSFSIPDGWRGTHSDTQAPVLLSAGQLTDSLSRVVGLPASSEAVSLPRGEGIFVNSGTLTTQGPEGGRIFIDSSHAAVNVHGGRLVASAESVGGQGGRIDLWSGQTSLTSAHIESRGGPQGQGGFVEVSGRTPQLLTAPDVSAPGGVAGTVLVDPNSIFISNVAPASEDPLLPTILFADPPGAATVSVQALESATGNLILEANNNIFWISAPADNSIDLQPGVSIRLTSGGSITANPGLAIRTTNGDITLQATNNIQAPGLFATNGVVLVESQTGQLTVAGSISADRVTLNAAGRIQTGTHTINAGAGGVSITGRTLLGNSGPGFDFESQINSSGPATFTFTGPDDPFAGATAKVRGSLTGGVSVNAPSGLNILINGAPPGGGGAVTPVPPPIFPNDQVPTGPEGFERPFLLQATAQQIIDLGNLETYFDLNPGSMDRLPVRNYSLLGPSPIPLYTLDLVGMQYSDDKEGFWRRYLDRFIIWEDEADEAQTSPGSRPDQ